MTQQAIGGALVLEVRHCSCGREYQMPHNCIAQLFMDTETREVREYQSATGSNIYGRHRTLYIYHSQCEACPVCFQTSIEWADIPAIHLPREHAYTTRGDAAGPCTRSEALSERDRLKTEQGKLKDALDAAQDAYARATSAWQIAKARVQSFNEVLIGPPRESTRIPEKPAKRSKQQEPIVPLSIDEL